MPITLIQTIALMVHEKLTIVAGMKANWGGLNVLCISEVNWRGDLMAILFDTMKSMMAMQT